MYYTLIEHSINIWLCVCGWLCTLYDGLSWLHEWPSLVMRALDLIVWVCTQGNYRRCIFMLYCVSWCDCLNPCHQVTLFSPCMWYASTCLTIWKATTRHGVSMLKHAIYTDAKPYQCAIAHQTQNFVVFSPWKWSIPIAIFSRQKLGENSILHAMMHLRRSAARFLPWK